MRIGFVIELEPRDVMRESASYGVVLIILMIGCATERGRQRAHIPSIPPAPVTINETPAPTVRLASTSGTGQGDGVVVHVEQAAFQPADTSTNTYTIEELESLALSNNPTIAQLVATAQKAAGYQTQVSLRANPILGYNGTQIADAGTDQHSIFISQTIITAGKLELNRCVLNEALRAQLFQLEAQKVRVATDVRVRFYDALAAQTRVALIRDFQSVVKKGLELAELRKKASEGSQLEVVQAKQQLAEAELSLVQAEASYLAAWRELVAMVGCPDHNVASLSGELPTSSDDHDWKAIAERTISESPEYQVALARLSQAQANLQRQNVQAVSNVDVNFASGVDNGTNSGMINLQVGAPIPVFNKNQGNIAAARAECSRAAHEIGRIEKSVKARIAAVSREYNVSMAAVNKYRLQILPNAKQSLELAELAYKAGEESFVQVLIARRGYFEANLQLLTSQATLAQSQARLDGYVLSGGLDPIVDESGDDSLRGLTFSQQ
jgi:outer membrane protein, heavy metal efflux system